MRHVRAVAVLVGLVTWLIGAADARAQATIAFVQGNYAVPQTPQSVVSVSFTAAQTAGSPSGS